MEKRTYKVVMMPIGQAPSTTLRIEAYDAEVDSENSEADNHHVYYNFLGKPDSDGNSVTLAAIPADHIYYVAAEEVTR